MNPLFAANPGLLFFATLATLEPPLPKARPGSPAIARGEAEPDPSLQRIGPRVALTRPSDESVIYLVDGEPVDGLTYTDARSAGRHCEMLLRSSWERLQWARSFTSLAQRRDGEA